MTAIIEPWSREPTRPDDRLRRMAWRWLTAILALTIGVGVTRWIREPDWGRELDRLNGVVVYSNGFPYRSHGRHRTRDGYNLGMKYQCVEFVKRYYAEALNHRMPETRGNAKDFFSKNIPDGGWNAARALRQFTNPSASRPQRNDLLVFGPTLWNPYGHVAIVSAVSDDSIEIVQQNARPTRKRLPLRRDAAGWRLPGRILGWLRK